jgi:hypothetical protein
VNAGNPNYASAGGVLFSKDMTTLIQFPGGFSGSYALPISVTRISDNAFANASSLMGVTFPDSVTNIGNWAFYDCLSLTSVTLPNRVTNIGDGSFYDCASLTNITVNAGNPNYASAGGVLFSKDMTTLIQFPGGFSGSYAISTSVTRIGDYAFAYCSGLTSVTLPNSVTNFGVEAFADCSSLTSVTLPHSVTSIGDSAFYGCFSLTSVMMGASVTSIGDSAFCWCSSLTNVTLPNSVTNIGMEAFLDCSSLTSVTLGTRVTSIGDRAFFWCSSLTNVTLPNSVTNIGVYAFAECSGLNQAFFQGNAPSVDGGNGSADSTVFAGESGTVYYLPGTANWGSSFGGWPTALWYLSRPQILGSNYGLGVQNNRYQFTIAWATNAAVVVEASTNLLNWEPVVTNTLSNGTNFFTDATWTHYPMRFYRARSN